MKIVASGKRKKADELARQEHQKRHKTFKASRYVLSDKNATLAKDSLSSTETG